MSGKTSASAEACIFASDADVRRDIQIYLKQNFGFSVVACSETADFIQNCRNAPRLIVVAAMRRGGVGLELVRQIRQASSSGFILYIASGDLPDEVGDAFGAGADDAIRTPFTMREFGLRLRARLGAGIPALETAHGATVPQVILDEENKLLAAGSRATAQLTRAEAEVMAVLIRSGGEIVSRNDLARAIDRTDWEYGDRRFDVHVASIRKKLRKAFGKRYELRAVRYRGYAFVEGAEIDSTEGRIGVSQPSDVHGS